jgi:hypothetical protein
MCERSDYQSLKCTLLFGTEYLELWCPGCAAEYHAWLDDQANEAQALDRVTGLGWLWEHVSDRSPN